MLVGKGRTRDIIKVDSTLPFCSEMSFNCRVISVNVEKSDGVFLCSAVGPFTHVCSRIFAGFHSLFLHPPPLSFLSFFS